MAGTYSSLIAATCTLFLRGMVDRGPAYYARAVDQSFHFDELSATARYRSRWLRPPPESPEATRRALLARLGLLPPGRPSDEAPRLVALEKKERFHGAGGTYVREVDSHGDRFGMGPDAWGWEELAPYFNVPRRSPGHPTAMPRFLREAAPDFPRDTPLSPEDLHALEPLPVGDPLRSYLSGAILRLATGDGDKPMPRYEPRVTEMLEPGRNYFRRADGTYYLYDIATGGLREYATTPPAAMAHPNERYYENFRGLVEAIAGLEHPEARAEAIRFVVDTVFLFPEITHQELARTAERNAHEDTLRSWDLALEEIDGRSAAFAAGRWLASFGGVEPPTPRSPWSGGRTSIRLGSYLLVPHVFLRLTEGPMPGVNERVRAELREALLQRVPAYRERMEATIRDADPTTARILTADAWLDRLPRPRAPESAPSPREVGNAAP